MAHIQKFKRGAVSQVAAHYRRLRDGEHYGNKNIDAARTAGNYYLGGEHDVTARVAELVARHKEVTGRALRKDAVVMYDVINTLPRNWPEERDQREYFDLCYSFNRAYFPGDALLAVVHVDETTPHMHQAFAPVDEDGRFAYKRLMPRSKYQDYHEELQKRVREKTGLDDLEILLGEETGAQRALSGAREQERLGAVLDYVGRQMDEYRDGRQAEVDKVEQTLSQVQDTLTRRQAELRDIDAQLPGKRTELDGLVQAVTQARSNRKTEEEATRKAHEKHERAKKACADAETQKATAVTERDKARTERDKARTERDKARTERDKARTERDKAVTARDKARSDADAEAKRLADLQQQSEVVEASLRSGLAQEKRTRKRYDGLKSRQTELETQIAEKETRLATLTADIEALIEQVWNRLMELWDKFGPWQEEHNQEWVTQAVDSVLEENERG